MTPAGHRLLTSDNHGNTRPGEAIAGAEQAFEITIAMDYNDHAPAGSRTVVPTTCAESSLWNEHMIPKVVEVKPLEGYRLGLRFHDGTIGTIDLSSELWGPMFEPLRDVGLFAKAAIDSALETVTWPNGADLAPEFLYQRVAKTRRSSQNAASR